MAKFDLSRNIKRIAAIYPAAANVAANVSGLAIDTQGYDSVAFAIQSGAGTTNAANHYVIAVLESADSNISNGTAIPAARLHGVPSGGVNAVNSVFEFGALPRQRYCFLTLTVAGTAANSQLSAVAILGNAAEKPTHS